MRLGSSLSRWLIDTTARPSRSTGAEFAQGGGVGVLLGGEEAVKVHGPWTGVRNQKTMVPKIVSLQAKSLPRNHLGDAIQTVFCI